MRIKNVCAKNYKTLENISIELKGNYCAISGINNSGKSSLIKLILSLLHSGDRPWSSDMEGFDYSEDRTQWVKDKS